LNFRGAVEILPKGWQVQAWCDNPTVISLCSPLYTSNTTLDFSHAAELRCHRV
jgi:hypothetical protein